MRKFIAAERGGDNDTINHDYMVTYADVPRASRPAGSWTEADAQRPEKPRSSSALTRT